MSNGTQEQNRNNGNRNRNRNRNQNRNNRNRNHNPDQKNNNPNRSVSQHQSFVNRKPVKLTFWQKILKLIGLHKEPAKSAKPEGRDKGNQGKPKFEGPRPERGPKPEKQAPRTNTRDARQGGEGRPAGEPRPPREPRAPRERREPTLANVESTRLYVGNLSYDATESDIEELFKGIGPVRSVEVVYNKHTHKSKGYGFVEMLRIDEAKRSVEVLHDQHFMGRQLIVSGAKAKNAEDIEEHTAARERKEQAVAATAATAAAAPVVAAPVVEAAATAVETTVAAAEETVSEVAAVAETAVPEAVVAGGVVEEVHSLEADSQKENFA